LLAILEEALLRSVGLVAVPAILSCGRVDRVSIFLKLIIELLKLIELFLLIERNSFICWRGCGLSGSV